MVEKVSILGRNDSFNEKGGYIFILNIFTMRFLKEYTDYVFAIIIIDRTFREDDIVDSTSFNTGRDITRHLVIKKGKKSDQG